MLPGESCWAAIPEPITSAARKAEPRNSASRLRRSAASTLTPVRLRLARRTARVPGSRRPRGSRARGCASAPARRRRSGRGSSVGARADRLRRAEPFELLHQRRQHLAQPPLMRGAVGLDLIEARSTISRLTLAPRPGRGSHEPPRSDARRVGGCPTTRPSSGHMEQIDRTQPIAERPVGVQLHPRASACAAGGPGTRSIPTSRITTSTTVGQQLVTRRIQEPARTRRSARPPVPRVRRTPAPSASARRCGCR